MKIICEGKVKIIIATDDPYVIIQRFKDDVTAFNKQKHDIVQGKGIICNHISAFIMEKLEEKGINTHFIRLKGEREQLVKKLEMIPLEVVVRNIAAGSFCKRIGLLKRGEKLRYPIIEFTYKNATDPLVSESEILYFNWLSSTQEIEEIKSIALKINKLLIDLFLSVGTNLVDLKLEFGRLNNNLILGDEISPDTWRLWTTDSNKILDKDTYRLDLGDLKSAYLEVASKLGIKID
ncbi:phosphoribosylaminoimidazolesuccinocarboxamide synthase [Wolbachia pipientis]|uniref:Phosphoribosylaminoimidazole-succinocarboxamide synthase n=1 Tax=Wolbachia pipientis TaxID=955 RepID=A0A1E7QKG6_WOLPI|nr:phosphoribosylaminoimidazolesuccinocarboxamide synthase [Wolbachia pipientis]OEY86971.1 phosphoribosylaminoimidazolesuccinocarboxamide synthase [Wolbachia pipientis]